MVEVYTITKVGKSCRTKPLSFRDKISVDSVQNVSSDFWAAPGNMSTCANLRYCARVGLAHLCCLGGLKHFHVFCLWPDGNQLHPQTQGCERVHDLLPPLIINNISNHFYWRIIQLQQRQMFCVLLCNFNKYTQAYTANIYRS